MRNASACITFITLSLLICSIAYSALGTEKNYISSTDKQNPVNTNQTIADINNSTQDTIKHSPASKAATKQITSISDKQCLRFYAANTVDACAESNPDNNVTRIVIKENGQTQTWQIRGWHPKVEISKDGKKLLTASNNGVLTGNQPSIDTVLFELWKAAPKEPEQSQTWGKKITTITLGNLYDGVALPKTPDTSNGFHWGDWQRAQSNGNNHDVLLKDQVLITTIDGRAFSLDLNTGKLTAFGLITISAENKGG